MPPKIEENTLALSTALDARPTRSYKSAEHAVGTYVRLAHKIRSCSALDFERLHLAGNSSPTIGNPLVEQMEEVWGLEAIFARVQRDVKATHWRVWVDVRGKAKSLREAARRETKRRRREVMVLPADRLEDWSRRHNCEVWPDGDETYRDALLEKASISATTASRYRDTVDAKVEQHLVGRGSLVRNAIREDHEVREIGHGR